MGRTNKARKTNKMYRNKDIEESKKYARRKNEIITYRLLLLFGVAVCAVGFFVYVMNMNINWDNTQRLDSITFAGLIVTGILLVMSVIFLVYRTGQAVDESDKIIHSKNIFAAAIFLFFADLLIFFTGQRWIPVMTAFTIAVIILVYIYYLYPREFFYFSFFSAMSGFFLYFAGPRVLPEIHQTGFRILMAACAVFILVFAMMLMKGKGQLKNRFLKVNIKILEKSSKYFQFFILAVFIAGLAAASLFSINFFYLIGALVVYFIIVGIYFTVKMI